MIPQRMKNVGQGRNRPPEKISGITRGLQDRYDNGWLAWASRIFLPDQANAIGGWRTTEERAHAFVNTFQERYFPLEDGVMDAAMDGLNLGDDWETNTGNLAFFASNIPTQCAGFGRDGLHDLWNTHPESTCLCAMLIQPSEMDHAEDDDLWLVWTEMALAKGVPQTLLQAMPQGGSSMAQIEAALVATPFKGAYAATSWITGCTYNMITDIYDPVEELGYGFEDDWTMDNVLGITETWREAKVILNAVNKFMDWLNSGDLYANHRQLVDYLKWRIPETKGKAETLAYERSRRHAGGTILKLRDTDVDNDNGSN